MGIVVGIGGASRAGKSTLSELIKNWYNNVSILSMDTFVFPQEKIPRIKEETDWEIPESVDFVRLARAIAEAKLKNEIVVVEGILIYSEEQILPLYDRKVFIEIDYDTFILRKKEDDRWEIPVWYMEHIWTSYIVFGNNNLENTLKVCGTKPYNKKIVKNFIDSGIISKS